MSDLSPIPWDEWEAQAQRLLRAQREVGRSWTLSSAKHLLARMLGRAHWHDVEQGLRAGQQLPWNRPVPSALRAFPEAPAVLDPLTVTAWLEAVQPPRPATLEASLWEAYGQHPWTWLAPLLIEGQRHGHWELTGHVALMCLDPTTWPALQRLNWSAEAIRAVERPLQGLGVDGDGAALAIVHRAWRQAWERHLSFE